MPITVISTNLNRLYSGMYHFSFSCILHLSRYSSHLGDLKSLTEDVLYETYRTEKLSRVTPFDLRYVWNLF